ncbi:hypothetical protein [Halalkalibacter krulwichiae]|uniref:Uncharacterized protein n=2 Tax=Halalkalibacter krulwichiae TaxID=199441 RepID=A0A1X9MBD7_9BACI|nr:hypothetical protein [Halalkalibacter krulwichiae]ARK30736.1 hypothetical protein BkAM31D_13345 [Halalkalibacter krulwichiae]
MENEDLKLSYSTCQFFYNGCTLKPSFKSAVCRTFICMTIEESLSETKQDELQYWNRVFQKEEKDFQAFHVKELQKRNINLLDNPHKLIKYFQEDV